MKENNSKDSKDSKDSKKIDSQDSQDLQDTAKQEKKTPRKARNWCLSLNMMKLARLIASGMPPYEATAFVYPAHKSPSKYWYQLSQNEALVQQIKMLREGFQFRQDYNILKRLEMRFDLYNKCVAKESFTAAVQVLTGIDKILGDVLPVPLTLQSETDTNLNFLERADIYRESLLSGIINQDLFDVLMKTEINTEGENVLQQAAHLLKILNKKKK
jgi:hypothetical protein